MEKWIEDGRNISQKLIIDTVYQSIRERERERTDSLILMACQPI